MLPPTLTVPFPAVIASEAKQSRRAMPNLPEIAAALRASR